MLGQHEDYDVIPYFFSDQYDTGLEYAGHIPHGAPTELVMRGDPTEGAFMAFWLTEDRVLAGMHVNVWDTIDDVKTLIRSRATLNPRHLGDPRHALVSSE